MARGIPNLDEIELAFIKLQANIYFDNYDLILRRKIADYAANGLERKLDRFNLEFKKSNPFENYFKKDSTLSFFPKKIKPVQGLPQNFYTNTRVIDGNSIEKPLVFCDFPVEFHLIATIWLLRYGGYIETKLSKNALGNRLITTSENNAVIEGRSLFKPYFRQFQNWWSSAIKKTKELLNNEENVTILNFDLQSFYHKVEFDFDELEIELKRKFPNIKMDVIHILLKKIHSYYREKLTKIYTPANGDIKANKFPLPIGLFTSHVFANWYLKRLDNFIERNIRPVYYGRYVDDILIVVKDTVLEMEDIDAVKDKKTLTKQYLQKYFGELFYTPNDGKSLSLGIEGLENLSLNEDKLFVYQFDSEYSPNLIDSFVDEQKERSSMFRFLSDEEDEYFGDFDAQTFESNFDHVEANKARFKELEDNKFKLSSFLSKLIKRRIQKGQGYKEEEVNKVSKYFKSVYLIKHYYFWEKLFTLFVVYNRTDKIIGLINDISVEINAIKISSGKDGEFEVTDKQYIGSLMMHFDCSLKMALGLNLTILENSKELQRKICRVFSQSEQSHNIYTLEEIEKIQEDYKIFKKTGLLRGSFIYYPLLQFTNLAKNTTINLTDASALLDSYQARKILVGKTDIDIPEAKRKFIPFRIKYWQAAMLTYYNNFCTKKTPRSKNIKLWHTDDYASGQLLDIAFDLFYDINKPTTERSTMKENLKRQYFAKTSEEEINSETPLDRSKNYYIQELYLPNGGKIKERLRICIVNKYVDLKNSEASLRGRPNRNPEQIEICEQVLDEISKISKCDLAIMPELALPHYLISQFTDQSARKQIGFITGIEHLNIRDVGFNFILTVLPVRVGGDKDAIPILRLKNHYAPEEEEWIREKFRLLVPKPKPYRYDLFEWRGIYFSTYHCYELADVFHRSIFFSKVDVIFTSVWNIDTHYYNSIIDAAVRDMHNYFVIVNTSQYGFSKIARPRDFVNKEKVILKGGTEDGYPFSLVVGDLKIQELREFQVLGFNEQKEANKEKKAYKPTPPDFSIENVRKRINNQRFYP